jgi:hypothetical protein
MNHLSEALFGVDPAAEALSPFTVKLRTVVA